MLKPGKFGMTLDSVRKKNGRIVMILMTIGKNVLSIRSITRVMADVQ